MIDVQDLNADRTYLDNTCSAVNNGLCPQGLSLRNPGATIHSTWLTTGTQILRLYIGSEHSLHELKTLKKFVIRVCAPMWFHIKPSYKNHARRLFRSIRRSPLVRSLKRS